MLEPTLVLEANLSVAEALAELDATPGFEFAVVRLAADDGVRWFAMPSRRLRWLLEGCDGNEPLVAALDLAAGLASEVHDAWTGPVPEGFDGVVLDGDRVAGVAWKPQVANVPRHRGKGPPDPQQPKAEPEPVDMVKPAPQKPEYTTVPVFYGTDRAAEGDARSAPFYGAERGELQLGVASVSIPKDRDRGELEEPTWWKLEFHPDPKKHVILRKVEPLARAEFLARAGAEVGRFDERQALVFVHGYNVSFENAARRTAQIAYDLVFPGAAVLYSWPSWASTRRYTEDATNARWSVDHFGEFLELVLTELGARTVHIIAHSMGNLVLAECLRNFAMPPGAAALRQIVLAAPDLDAGTFEALAREFHGRGQQVTLYCSSRDLALKASRKFVHGHQRAGESEPHVVIVDGVDTVDASAVDTNLLGHSYVGDSSSILADIYELVTTGNPPEERRFRLEPREQEGRRYWLFRT